MVINRYGNLLSNIATGTVSALLGHLAVPLYCLVIISIIDYITGLNAALCRGQKISSNIGIAGIRKKVIIWLLVLVGWIFDVLVAYSGTQFGLQALQLRPIACLVTIWLCVNEMISILENMQDMGIAMPKWLLPLMQHLRSKISSPTKTGEDTHEV